MGQLHCLALEVVKAAAQVLASLAGLCPHLLLQPSHLFFWAPVTSRCISDLLGRSDRPSEAVIDQAYLRFRTNRCLWRSIAGCILNMTHDRDQGACSTSASPGSLREQKRQFQTGSSERSTPSCPVWVTCGFAPVCAGVSGDPSILALNSEALPDPLAEIKSKE